MYGIGTNENGSRAISIKIFPIVAAKKTTKFIVCIKGVIICHSLFPM